MQELHPQRFIAAKCPFTVADLCLHLIFAPCTGFQSMLESNTNCVLFVSVLSLLLVSSTFPIYARFTHSLGNSDRLQTSVYCAFHLSTLGHTIRIKYKLCSLCFGAIASTGIVYLSDLRKIYTLFRQLRSSADIRKVCIPSVITRSYGERSFS